MACFEVCVVVDTLNRILYEAMSLSHQCKRTLIATIDPNIGDIKKKKVCFFYCSFLFCVGVRVRERTVKIKGLPVTPEALLPD